MRSHPESPKSLSIFSDDPSEMGLEANIRRGQSLWLFSDMLVSFGYGSMTEGKASDTEMALDVNCYTSLPMSDGVNAIFSMGFGYWSETYDTGVTGVSAVTSSEITLPNSSIGVEADVTDYISI